VELHQLQRRRVRQLGARGRSTPLTPNSISTSDSPENHGTSTLFANNVTDRPWESFPAGTYPPYSFIYIQPRGRSESALTRSF